MSRGSLLGTILRTILDYKRGPYVHCCRPLHRAHIDCSSCGRGELTELGRSLGPQNIDLLTNIGAWLMKSWLQHHTVLGI